MVVRTDNYFKHKFTDNSLKIPDKQKIKQASVCIVIQSYVYLRLYSAINRFKADPAIFSKCVTAVRFDPAHAGYDYISATYESVIKIAFKA